MDSRNYFTPKTECQATSPFLQSSSPMIEFLNRIHPVECSPTTRVQSCSASLQLPDPFAQQTPAILNSALFPNVGQEYGAVALPDFCESSKPQRKRSLENTGFFSEPRTPSTLPHSSLLESGATRKKPKTGHSSTRPLPERHARKQNFACDLCRKLKIKCVFHPGTEKCERCERGSFECLDGSSMRAAAAAVRSQQGLKKRRKRTSELNSCEPDPLLIRTRKIQTRSTADVLQEVVDEPNSIGIGSVVQVKKSTQHHYMAKESVVTRVVCKVVAVYLDGSESDAIPVNLVRLSEKWKNNLKVNNAILEQEPYDFPGTSANEWQDTENQVPIPYVPSVNHAPSHLPLPANVANPIPVKDSLPSEVSTSDDPSASAPLSLLGSIPTLNTSHEGTMHVATESVLNLNSLSELPQSSGVSGHSSNTSSINTATTTPNTVFNPHAINHSPLTASPTYEGSYALDTMFSTNVENFQLYGSPHTKCCTIDSHNDAASEGYAFAALQAASSPTETSHSNKSSSTIFASPHMSDPTDSTAIPEISIDCLRKLQDLLNTILEQHSLVNLSEHFVQGLEPLNSRIMVQNALK